jgi:hypothetical protein
MAEAQLQLARGASDNAENSGPDRRRYRLRSEVIEVEPSQIEIEREATPLDSPPPSGYELDQLNYHIGLQDFGRGLQNAADAVFSSDRRSRYTQVSPLLLS